MNTQRHAFSILIALFIFFASFGARAFTCSSVFQRPGGAAVELEMSVTNEVLNILTTIDGKVGGLFPNNNLPEFYLKWSQANHPGKDPKMIEWDLLNDPTKLALLRDISAKKKSSFFDDRKVPNVKVKPIIHVKFEQETVFLGQKYNAGEYDIDISNFFGRVEYRGPESAKDFSGVELHLRSSEIEAGNLIESAWNFQVGIGAGKTHLHEHIVAPIPLEALEKAPVQTSLVLAEYFRRANLLAEIVTIGNLGSISANEQYSASQKVRVTYFDSITPSFLSGIFHYFFRGFGEHEQIGSDYKMGWVGFRGADVYDQANMYGLEYRALSANDNLDLHKKILSSIQTGMKSQRYGFSPEEISNWMTSRGVRLDNIAKIEETLEGTWYKHSYRELFKRTPGYLRAVLGGPIRRFFKYASLRLNSNGNQAVKMLLYDWSSDPLFHGDSQAKEKLMQEQQKALQKYFNQGEMLSLVVREFIWESGVLDRIAKGFNLEKNDFDVLIPKR